MRSSSNTTKKLTFYLLCFAGLSDTVKREFTIHAIKGKFIDQQKLKDHDLIIWQGGSNEVRKFSKLRTVEDIFYAVDESHYSLARLRDLKNNCKISFDMFRQSVFRAIEFKNILFGKRSSKKSVSYTSFVKQDIDHGPARKAVGHYLDGIFASTFPKWKHQDPADIECWGFWVSNLLFVGVRITSSHNRSRNYRQEERKASLRPTIAAAMVVLSQPNPKDKILDPMCGTGTLLIERGLIAPYELIEGYDIDQDAIRLAADNVGRSKLKKIYLNNGDARNLPVENEKFNCIVSNLPFGKVYGSIQTNLDLYHKCLQEWSRLIKSNGRAVLLTSDAKTLHQAQSRLSDCWRIDSELRLKVLGVWASCFVLSRQ
jgi:tRNA (guanine6-N2)-methyltransferase